MHYDELQCSKKGCWLLQLSLICVTAKSLCLSSFFCPRASSFISDPLQPGSQDKNKKWSILKPFLLQSLYCIDKRTTLSRTSHICSLNVVWTCMDMCAPIKGCADCLQHFVLPILPCEICPCFCYIWNWVSEIQTFPSCRISHSAKQVLWHKFTKY